AVAPGSRGLAKNDPVRGRPLDDDVAVRGQCCGERFRGVGTQAAADGARGERGIGNLDFDRTVAVELIDRRLDRRVGEYESRDLALERDPGCGYRFRPDDERVAGKTAVPAHAVAGRQQKTWP